MVFIIRGLRTHHGRGVGDRLPSGVPPPGGGGGGTVPVMLRVHFGVQSLLGDQYCGARSLHESRSLNPSLKTFDGWLAENVDRIPEG